MSMILFVVSLLLIQHSSGMQFKLNVDSEKCIRDETHENVLVTGNYDVSGIVGVKVNIKVIDTNSHILYQNEDIKEGKFAFTTDNHDMFQICFVSKASFEGKFEPHEVHLSVKHGVEAKNYEELAKTEKLKPLEVELRRLEDLSHSIAEAFAYMKQREAEMRDTNESTNSRVLYFSIFSMICLIALATWQVLYLRQFFKSKKLIE